MSGDTLSKQSEAVRKRAADLASQLSVRARRSATIAQERAVLRMLGVDGLDRVGRPLAATVADGYCGSDAGRLSRGVLLPFTVAMLEYDMGPHELALDVASGAVDLELEAGLLARPDRFAAAQKKAGHLLGSALARFDANRTAAREMREVLGMPPEPWLGVAVEATEVEAAISETRAIVGSGAGLVQIRVPASWEFAEARRQAGLDIPGLFEEDGPRGERSRGEGRRWIGRRLRSDTAALVGQVPAGSQRGLAALRQTADEAAAERRCYANLMTVTSAFAAPEQAVVAAFERIDYVAVDPIREIVEDNVDPDRALADHSFAHRLQARAGCRVVIGPGPLALGPDVASGIPSDATTRAGRALALQALGTELALAGGVAADRLMLGAVPDWVVDEGNVASILLQTWLRRAVFPSHRLALGGAAGWIAAGRSAAAVASMAGAPASVVLEPCAPSEVSKAVAALEVVADAARAVRTTLGDGALHGDAADAAARTLATADAVLAKLAAEGWSSLLGPGGPGALSGRDADLVRLGSAAVVERASGPDASERLLRDFV